MALGVALATFLGLLWHLGRALGPFWSHFDENFVSNLRAIWFNIGAKWFPRAVFYFPCLCDQKLQILTFFTPGGTQFYVEKPRYLLYILDVPMNTSFHNSMNKLLMLAPLFLGKMSPFLLRNYENLLNIASDFRHDLWLAPFPSSEAPFGRF